MSLKEPKDMNGLRSNLTLQFLGTGNAFSMDNRYWGSILVDNRIILDASPIIVPHMKMQNLDLTRLEYIFITHFHGDHFFGLPFLLLDYGYFDAPKHPLVIIGPSGLKVRIQKLTNLGFTGLLEKLEGRVELKFIEIDRAGKNKALGFQFNAEAMSHGGNKAFGYKFTLKGKTIAYTGDTDLCDGVYRLAEETDYLIIELSNPDQDVPGHMSLEKLKILREKIEPNVKIILNHLGPMKNDITKSENVIIPDDFEVIKI